MIILYTGPMFSSKSYYLTQHLDETSIAFIPKLDSRSGSYISSRTGDKIPAQQISSVMDFGTNIVGKSKVIIDEIQFLDPSIIDFVIKYKDVKTWVLAGLDKDYLQIDFENTATVLANADKVFNLTARCEKCGKSNAIYTCRKQSTGNDRIVVGSDQYYPLCKKCLAKYGNNSL